MLTLHLSAHDGGTAWRHLLKEGEARAGFEPVGPIGLVRRIGRMLGLPSQPAEQPLRIADLALKLDQHDDGKRSYSASRKQDPFGVARHLLGLRDQLRLAGWDGRALEGSDRLRDLAALESLGSPLPPGEPDVLAELLSALSRSARLPVPLRIELASPGTSFSPLLRRLLEQLEAAKAEVVEAPSIAPLAEPSTDLGRLQRALLDSSAPGARLQGDGSVVVLEADAALEAAELAASFARAMPLASTTFVVAAEAALLDAALARQGLPTLGIGSPSKQRPHLQILPLRLSLAFTPRDPFRAAELLLLPGAPLPGRVRYKLLGALAKMPGIGSPAWRKAADAAAAEAEPREPGANAPEDAAASLRAQIDAWFGGALHDRAVGIPAAEAARICAQVATWAGGRLRGSLDAAEEDPATGAADDAGLWAHAAAVAHTLERLLLARPSGECIPQQQLLKLHDLAAGSGAELAAFAGEAGRTAVATHPGQVTAAADDIVWWGFVLDADPGAACDPWTEVERAGLGRAGVALRPPGEVRSVEAAGWRLPVLCARKRAVFVRWRLLGAVPAAPHPFFDEVTTRVEPGSLACCTISSEAVLDKTGASPFKAKLSRLAPDAPMGQRAVWKVPPETVAPTGTLNASELEALLGCPFRWAIHHRAKLEPGRAVNLPDGSRLLGIFAHRILQDMLCGPNKLDLAKAQAKDAREWAARAFDERVQEEAAPLVRRGVEVERDRARTLVADAAASLVEVLRESGWKPVDAEREVHGTFAGQEAKGYVDLIVEKNGVEGLFDLKLSRLKDRQQELEEGRALQPALYASMLGKRRRTPPPSGFFILSEGRLLTTEPAAFPGATVVEGPSTTETLEASAEGFEYWRQVLAAGVLPVLHPQLPWVEPVEAIAGPPPDEGSPARRENACKYCECATLCVPQTDLAEEGR